MHTDRHRTLIHPQADRHTHTEPEGLCGQVTLGHAERTPAGSFPVVSKINPGRSERVSTQKGKKNRTNYELNWARTTDSKPWFDPEAK